ncbi:MAG: hypothetical protein NC409_07165 [Clostridium sp.]|nr:hypothetical protein [Clostridium sp.]
MEKKTNKLIYVILGILAVLFAALIPFSIFRRKQLLAEGELELADFSVTMGMIGLVFCLIFCGIIFLLCMRDRRIGARQRQFQEELKRTPAFARWLSNEEEQVKAALRASRSFNGFLSLFLLVFMLGMLYLFMDGIGGPPSDLDWLSLFAFLFCLFVFCFLWWISDYRKQYMRSILRSVSEQLPSDAEKDAFGSQLSKSGVLQFSYFPDLQTRASTAWVAETYSYFRQLRKCRILQNRYIGRVTLKKVPFMIELRTYWRIHYVMELSASGGQEPFWRGYFRTEEELYYALNAFRRNGLSDACVENTLQGAAR